jgi:type VI secretion system secreted protein Hcp
VDLATPKLKEILAKGGHIKTAVFSLCERTSTTTVEYLRITMTDVLVPSMNTGGDCVSGRPIDTLTFAKISVQYTRQSSPGAGLSVNFNWDFGANRGF